MSDEQRVVGGRLRLPSNHCPLTCPAGALTVAAISLVNTAAIQVIDTLAETIDFCKPEDAINEVCSASSKHEMWASHVPAVRKTSFVAALASIISKDSARSAGGTSAPHNRI